MRSSGLIAISLAAIEAMQRSNVKQFRTLCDYQCSYDARKIREQSLSEFIIKNDYNIDEALNYITSYYTIPSSVKEVDLSMVKIEGGVAPISTIDGSPIDVTHTILQLIRLVCIFRFHDNKHWTDEAFKKFKKTFFNYIVHYRSLL